MQKEKFVPPPIFPKNALHDKLYSWLRDAVVEEEVPMVTGRQITEFKGESLVM